MVVDSLGCGAGTADVDRSQTAHVQRRRGLAGRSDHRDLPRLESMSGIATTTLGEIPYLNTANVRLRTPISPIPAEELETALLVTNR